jgi:GNAT superfamily N-acetyltransferase
VEIMIRDGGPDDIPAILGLLDGAAEWLVAQGRTGQWGTEPLSARPSVVDLVTGQVTHGACYIAEADGIPVGMLTLTDAPGGRLRPADEPERFVRYLATDPRFKGLGVGSDLLAHAAEETRRAGVSLLRVDCYAGDDGKLVRYYEINGFVRTETYTGKDDWPGQVLARRV